MLPLGIPPDDGKRSPMMAAWAPDLVTSADSADLAASMASGRDVYRETEPGSLVILVTTTYILKRADTGDVWF